jgi:hypothetical protein
MAVPLAFGFRNNSGLLGDDGHPDESIIHLPDLNVIELLFLLPGEDGYWIMIRKTLRNLI